MKKRILIWETSEKISGGQRMTLNVVLLFKDIYDFVFIIPKEGPLSIELDRLSVEHHFACPISMAHGHKKLSNIFNYFKISKLWLKVSKKVIKEKKPDLLYCPGPAALPWSAISGRKYNLPVIWHIHHVFFDKKTCLLLNHYAKFKNVRRIIGVSNVVCKQIKNSAGSKKTVILYNPVDFLKYNNSNNSIDKEIKKLIPEYDFDNMLVFAHIGNIQEEKKQDFTIELLDSFSNKHKTKVLCLFAGKITDVNFSAKFTKLIQKKYNFVRFLYLGERNDIPSILKSINYVIIPSSEGFPLAALEAMCCGIPVLGASGGAGELINESGCGEVFEYLSIESATNALECLIKNEKDYYNNGINYAKESSMEKYKDNMLKIMEEII